jgi:GNAT superfamily N-acetyltransferase
MEFERLHEARAAGYPAADYFGVYAIEGEEVLSVVRVLRLPFTTPKGRETVAAIQGVVTRRDRSRMGLARRLLEEVHRRERAIGIRFALLWTGYNNVARKLYNSLGYVDVYTPELAMRFVERSPKPKGYELRAAQRKDWNLVEKLHSAATEGRLGFVPRPRGIVKSLIVLGFLEQEQLQLILRDGEPVGYVVLQRNPMWSKADEVVLLDGGRADAVLSLLESEAAGGWLVFRNTFVRDVGDLFRRRCYSITGLSYYGLLTLPLVASQADASRELGISSRSFSCQLLDYF